MQEFIVLFSEIYDFWIQIFEKLGFLLHHRSHKCTAGSLLNVQAWLTTSIHTRQGQPHVTTWRFVCSTYALPCLCAWRNEVRCIDDEIPFELPPSWWWWCRFGDIVKTFTEKAPERGIQKYWGNGYIIGFLSKECLRDIMETKKIADLLALGNVFALTSSPQKYRTEQNSASLTFSSVASYINK